ncbi:response regulator [Aquabacterium sp. A7-Y]|uniref:response regulator n=1 Tax=Aquabacterium sp. A7-Y TaxID=1349605 RepID=UPI00223CF423|nr:response regulator [Aquabacterium sp. A7-Y]MCW7536710.1 response regulator [Aquabacterium sp. A7-Y]
MTTFDFAEVFTTGARYAFASALKRRQSLSFDYHGPLVTLQGDEVQMQCAIHRLLCGAGDVLAEGFVMLHARVTLNDAESVVLISAGGTGPLCDNAMTSQVMQRLHLQELARDRRSEEHVRSAFGTCPNTGASLVFTCIPSEGALFNFRLAHLGGVTTEPDVSARGASAWVTAFDGVVTESLLRQLQRLGWRTTHFSSCEDAADALAALAPRATPPAWLVVVERQDAPLASLRRLNQLLPASALRTLTVPLGAATLETAGPLEGFEVRLYPFSPAELNEQTLRARSGAAPSSGLTIPAPLFEHHRPVLLIVDDNEVNRLLAGEMARVLGYSVETAIDAFEGIERCAQRPPQVVLMDIDMPYMDGYEAARRIRRKQSVGELPPFTIIALTAGLETVSSGRANEAGMDGHLSKPLNLLALQSELHRLVLPSPQVRSSTSTAARDGTAGGSSGVARPGSAAPTR